MSRIYLIKMLKKILLAIILAIAVTGYTHAQTSQSNSDLSTVNVDDMSDEQIKAYLKRAQSSGLSEQQLLIMAKQRGMSEVQIQKLRNRINSLGVSSGTSSDTGEGIQRLREDNQTQPITQSVDLFEGFVEVDSMKMLQDILKAKELKIFGSQIFANAELNFEPSLNTPTPRNYQIGPGDEVVVDIWGASEQSYALTVSPEGSIKVSNLGPIYVSGMTVEQATAKVKSRMTKIYAGLLPENGPNTYFQLTLGSIRSVKINVIGEVTQPGTYTVSSFSNVFNALYYAGGPSETGSMRNIQLIRNNKVVGQLDLYQYLLKGKLTTDLKLEDQDVVLVKPYENRVILEGEVKRPAIYELKKGESLSTVIGFAGGFTENAYSSNVFIKRNGAKEREVLTVAASDFAQTTIQNGDAIRVNKILDRFSNRVRIEGAVNMPGEFELKKGLTLKQLIEQAEGLRGDAFTERALLIRLNDDFTISNQSFNVGDLLTGEQEDIQLRKEDLVKVASIFDLAEDKTLTIEGEVIKPGTFPFIEGMTVEDLIVLSGGLKEGASEKIIEVARRPAKVEQLSAQVAETFEFSIGMGLSDEASTFVLKPYDIVTVRKSPGYTEQITVEVEGEVKYPGSYALKIRDERISDLIARAGGITTYGYPKGAQLIRRTEFYEAEESENKAAVKQKKEALEAFQEKDTLVDQLDIKQFETVAIDLMKILANPRSKYDLRLQEGDVLSIPRQLETVRVKGEILYPLTIKYEGRMSFRDYVSASGGTNDRARLAKSFVIYPNGKAAKTKRFLYLFRRYPKVEPGSEIIIPKKPEKNGLSIQEILAITTTLSTLSLIIDRLSN